MARTKNQKSIVAKAEGKEQEASETIEATFTPPEPVAPANKRGTSTVKNPVGITWVTCLKLVKDGKAAARKELHKAVMDQGVTYHTARTQVQRFLKWFNSGQDPKELPRGITIEE